MIVRTAFITLTCFALHAATAPDTLKQVKSFDAFAQGKSASAAFNELIDQKIPVVVKFFLPGCGPCKSTETEFEDLAKQYKDSALFVVLDTTKNDLANKFKVHAVPTFIIFKNGKKISDFRRGGLDKDGFAASIKKELKKLNVLPGVVQAPAAA